MIYLYCILGTIGYIICGIIVTLMFFRMQNYEPDDRAGLVAVLWPIFVFVAILILPFYGIHMLVHYVYNRFIIGYANEKE